MNCRVTRVGTCSQEAAAGNSARTKAAFKYIVPLASTVATLAAVGAAALNGQLRAAGGRATAGAHAVSSAAAGLLRFCPLLLVLVVPDAGGQRRLAAAAWSALCLRPAAGAVSCASHTCTTRSSTPSASRSSGVRQWLKFITNVRGAYAAVQLNHW